jgi:hypothetical protein
MKRVGYGEEKMMNYFKQVIDWKVLRGEPILLYHHPSDECWGVLEELFRMIHEMHVPKVRLVDFSRWWTRRCRAIPEMFVENKAVSVRGIADAEDVWVEATLPEGGFHRFQAGRRSIPLSDTGRSGGGTRLTPPRDIERIREFDVRTWFADSYNAVLRKLR